MGAGAALAVLCLCVATVRAQEGEATIEFRGENFIMTCPDEGKWFKNDVATGGEKNRTLEKIYSSDSKGQYSCDYGEETPKKHYFYVRGKVCANCVELNPYLFILVICCDVAMTVVVMTIIYKCTKKTGSDGAATSSKAPARPGGRAPPVPSTDYEPLNPHTRNQDIYS